MEVKIDNSLEEFLDDLLDVAKSNISKQDFNNSPE